MKKLAILILSVALAGCATGGYQVTGKTRPQILPEQVKIYDQMPAGAEIVGHVQANNANGFTSGAHPEIDKLKKEAAEIGANGVFITSKSWHYFQGDNIEGTAFFIK